MGRLYFGNYREASDTHGEVPEAENALREFFNNREVGRGIWKWEHYFEMYQRHLKKFVGRPISMLEIGVYSGGSLEMWRSYFGDQCMIHGVDIEKACKAYENEYTEIHIGDQEDSGFWEVFREKANRLDIIIDDGGHTPNQQRVTLEEMLPHLNFGGVYICEDIHGDLNSFTRYATELVDGLNHYDPLPGEDHASDVSALQQSVHSIHFYPYALVIEKNHKPIRKLVSPKRGTQWQPFL